jgi:dihydropyrimidinase
MARLLIRGGLLVAADGSQRGDILVEGERITAVGPDLAADGAEVIDASGRLVMPGGIDPHVHLNLPMFDTVSSDDHYTGLKAAAFGGTTTAIDFVPQAPGGSLLAAIDDWHQRADLLAAVDFGFHMNVTSLTPQTLAEIPALVKQGVTSVKVFTAYNGRLRLQDGEIYQVMRAAGAAGLTTLLHAENGDVIDLLTAEALAAGHTEPIWHARTRPAWGAVEAVLRAIALAEQADANLYVVHLNTAGGLDQIRYGRQRGAAVVAETCPQYLFFTEDQLARPDAARWICSPPLRTAADNRALWQGLEDGSIEVFSTDHCPFFYDGTQPIQYEGQPVAIAGKELGAGDFTRIPNGLPGIGDRMLLLWSYGVAQGRITPERFVALASTNAAKIFGLYPRKGALLPGSDADLVIWDPDRRWVHGVAHSHHRTDHNLYEGWEMIGQPERVYLRGELIVDGDRWLGRPGGGRFLERGPGADLRRPVQGGEAMGAAQHAAG